MLVSEKSTKKLSLAVIELIENKKKTKKIIKNALNVSNGKISKKNMLNRFEKIFLSLTKN